MIRSSNIWFTAWAFLAALTLSATVLPQAVLAQETKRVAVLEFTGQSAGAFQAQITGGLKGHPEIELVSNREVKGTADRLGNSLSSANDIKEVAEALELSAVIEGSIAKKGRGLEGKVRVHDGSTGQVVHEETWSKRRSQMKTIKPTVWAALGPSIRQTSAPSKGKAKTKPSKTKPVAVAEPEEDLEGEDEGIEAEEEEAPKKKKRVAVRAADEEEAPPREGGEEDEPKKRSRPDDRSVQHPALVVLFGPRIMWRTLSYDGSTTLASYSSTDQGSPAFNLALAAQWYPTARSSTAWHSNLGLDLDTDYSLGLKSKLSNGQKLSTTAYELGIGALYRMQLGSFSPRVRLGYVKQVFDAGISTALQGPPTNYQLPASKYSALRIGIGTGIDLGDMVVVDVSFAYLPVLGVGDLSEKRYGNKVSTSAFEAGAGVLVRFKEVYGVRAALDYRRYGYDFGLASGLDGVTLPKGGSDSYLRTTLSFVYTLPGQK